MDDEKQKSNYKITREVAEDMTKFLQVDLTKEVSINVNSHILSAYCHFIFFVIYKANNSLKGVE